MSEEYERVRKVCQALPRHIRVIQMYGPVRKVNRVNGAGTGPIELKVAPTPRDDLTGQQLIDEHPEWHGAPNLRHIVGLYEDDGHLYVAFAEET